MIMYDFVCAKCRETFEKFAKLKDTGATCPHCGGEAVRKVSTPRIKLDGTDPSFPSAWDSWGRKHEQAAKRAYKREDLGGRFNGDN